MIMDCNTNISYSEPSRVDQTADSSLVEIESSVGLPTNLGSICIVNDLDLEKDYENNNNINMMMNKFEQLTCSEDSRVAQKAGPSLVDSESSVGMPTMLGLKQRSKKYHALNLSNFGETPNFDKNEEGVAKIKFSYNQPGRLRPISKNIEHYASIDECKYSLSNVQVVNECGCNIADNPSAKELLKIGYDLLNSDSVDGIGTSRLKEIKRIMYKIYALGVKVGEVVIGARECFCDFVARVDKLRGVVKVQPGSADNNSVCKCCNISEDARVCHIFTTAIKQIDEIDSKTTRPLVNRLSKKMNVLVNTLRQLSHFACLPCTCELHLEDDHCVCGVNKKLKNLHAVLDTNIRGSSGVEQHVTSQVSNVHMIDQRESARDTGFVTGNATITHKQLAMSERDWSLDSLMTRPMYIGTYQWTKDSTEVIKKLVVPSCLKTGVNVNVFNSFNFVRGSVEIQFQVNGTKFHVGKLLCYFFPYPESSDEIDSFDINTALAMPHVVLDASLSNSGVLDIPHSHFYSYLQTVSGDIRKKFGVVIIKPFNALKVATGASPSLSVSVWARWKSCEWHQPYTHIANMPVGSMGYEAMDNRPMEEPVEDTSSAGITLSGTNAKASSVASVFSDMSKVAGGVAAGARLLMNLDKPLDGVSQRRWVPSAISDTTHGIGVDRSTRLGLLPNGILNSNERVLGSTDCDMNILTVAKQFTRLKTVTWTKDHVTGRVLYAFPVTPTVYDNKAVEPGTGYTKYSVTNLAYCSRPFVYWTGSIQVNLEFVASIMHTGRILIGYVAGSYDETITLDNLKSSALMVFDLQENKSCTVRIPYMYVTPWCRADKFIKDAGPFSSYESTGMVYVVVLNQLVIPTGVSSSVEINVNIAAGDDFKLAVPADLTGFRSNGGPPPLKLQTQEIERDHEIVTSNGVHVPTERVPIDAYVAPVPNLTVKEDVLESDVSAGIAPRVGERPVSNYVVRTVQDMTEYLSQFSLRQFKQFDDVKIALYDAGYYFDEEMKVFNTMDPMRVRDRERLVHTQIQDRVVSSDIKSLKPLHIQIENTKIRDGNFYGNLAPKYLHMYDAFATKYFVLYVRVSEHVFLRCIFSVNVNVMKSKGILKDRWPVILYYIKNQYVMSHDEFYQMMAVMAHGTTGVEHIKAVREQPASATLALGNQMLSENTVETLVENAMDLQTVLRRFYPVSINNYYISNTDISNVPYLAIPVSTRIACTNKTFVLKQVDRNKKVVEDVTGCQVYNHINHFSGLFTFYRGGTRWKFMISSAKVKDLEIVVIYRPNLAAENALDTIHYCKTEKFLSAMSYGLVLYQGKIQSSIECEVPYHSRFVQLAQYRQVTGGVYDLTTSNGCIQVFFIGREKELSLQMQILSSIADDTVFSYIRSAPYLYLDSEVETARNLENGAKVTSFSLGMLSESDCIPIGCMGLFDMFTKTNTVIDTAYDNLPEAVNLIQGGSKIVDLVQGIFSGLNVVLDVTKLVVDICCISDAYSSIIYAEGGMKIFHIGRLILLIATRFVVDVRLEAVMRFVSFVLHNIGRWPQDRNTPVGTSGAAVNFLTPICVAIVGFVCQKALPDNVGEICKKVLPCFRFVNDGARCAETMMSWVDPFIVVLRDLAYKALFKVFPGVAGWLKVTDRVDEIVEWMKDIDHIDEELVPMRAAKDIEYKHHIMALYDKAMDYTEHISRGDDKHLASTIRTYARNIIRIHSDMVYSTTSASSRVDPFSVCLVGAPGGGKSAMLPTLIHGVLNALEFPKNNRIYARNSSDQYWSRYKGEIAVIMDDFDQIVDSPAVKELIDIKTNNVYPLNQAAVEKKGQLFSSEMIVLTSNSMYPTSNDIKCRDALWRRRNLLIEVQKNRFDRDEIGFSHLWFRVRDALNPDATPGPVMNLEELIALIVERMRVYLDKQYALVARNEALAVGRAGETLYLDLESIDTVPEFKAFRPEIFECLTAMRNGTHLEWTFSSDDSELREEWVTFQGMYHDITGALRRHLTRSTSSMLDEFKTHLLKVAGVVWKELKANPIYVAIAIGTALLLGWKYYHGTRAIQESVARNHYTMIQHKAPVRHAIAAHGVDVNSDSLIEHRVLPYIYRYRRHMGEGMYACQNAFALGDRWVVTVRHAFSQDLQRGKDEIDFELLYSGEWIKFTVSRQNWRLRDRTDLIFIKLDSRFHEHRNNVRHFIDEDDLGKLKKVDISYVGAEDSENKIIKDTVARPLESMVYLDPFMGENITIYRAWIYDGVDKPSTCGGVIVAHETKIVGKILGIHVAASPGLGYAHVMTRQLVESILGEKPRSEGVVIPKSIGPLPNSFPEGHFGYIGRVSESIGTVNRSELVPSLVHGLVGPVLTGPSVLSSTDARLRVRCSPLYNAIKKMGEPSAQIDDKILKLCLKTMIARLRLVNNGLPRILTEQEAICGIEKAEYLERINMATSAGLPYVLLPEKERGKAWLFNDNMEVVHPLLRERLDLRESEAKDGKRIESIWIDCLKDEKRNIEKVHAGSTRLFQVPPTDFTILMRKYYLGFVAGIMKARDKLPSQVGINPYGPEWTRLYERLTEFSPYYFCGDYKNFDKSTLPQLMEAFGTWADAYYKRGRVDEEQYRDECSVRHVLVEELIHTVHQHMDKVYMSHHGNPSGNPITTVLNGFVNEMLMLMAWIIIHMEAEEATTPDEFYQYVLLLVYGDDNVVAVKREKTDIFNQYAVAGVLKQWFGIEYTDDTKQGVGEFRSIEKVTFLKNKFGDHHDRPFYKMAQLDKDTIREMCNWVRGTMDVSLMTEVNVNNSCRFAYFHGREFYDNWVQQMMTAYEKIGVDWIPPTFESFDLWFLTQFEGTV